MEVNYTGKQVVGFYDTDHSGSVSLREAQAGYHRARELEGRLNR
jgi:hypothetical protein